LILLDCCSFLASAGRAVGFSYSLAHDDSFEPFLFAIAGSITFDSLMFLLLPKTPGFEKIGWTGLARVGLLRHVWGHIAVT
jgi:hypothetical protein